MEKQRIAIIQLLDDNIMRRITDDVETQNILSLSLNLRDWCEHHQYSHYVHYLTDDYKTSDEFKTYMYNDYTKVQVYNIDQNGHSKVYGFIKTLEYLEEKKYDYVCMLDMDICYVEKTRSIESYLTSINAENKEIIAALECVDPKEFFDGKSPNGGVYLFKNTDWVKRFLKGLILAQTRIGYSNHRLTTCMMDQMQMSFFAMTCPDCDDKFLITSHHDSIQKWYNHNGYEYDLANYKTIFFHFAGRMKENIPMYFNKMIEHNNKMVTTHINFEKILIKH